MMHPYEKRFREFFVNDLYAELKNELYNYRVRKWAISRKLLRDSPELVLEVGSGLSPIIISDTSVVYSELSFEGITKLRCLQPTGWYVVADCTKLPFKSETFSHAVCSEVLEHVEHDDLGLAELSRVLRSRGRLYLTFPHRKFYYWNDDRYVGHFRRYELEEMVSKLAHAHLRLLDVRKVLGPLEKLTMSFAVFILPAFLSFKWNASPARSIFASVNLLYAGIAWLDAKIMPRTVSAVLMIRAQKAGPTEG